MPPVAAHELTSCPICLKSLDLAGSGSDPLRLPAALEARWGAAEHHARLGDEGVDAVEPSASRAQGGGGRRGSGPAARGSSASTCARRRSGGRCLAVVQESEEAAREGQPLRGAELSLLTFVRCSTASFTKRALWCLHRRSGRGVDHGCAPRGHGLYVASSSPGLSTRSPSTCSNQCARSSTGDRWSSSGAAPSTTGPLAWAKPLPGSTSKSSGCRPTATSPSGSMWAGLGYTRATSTLPTCRSSASRTTKRSPNLLKAVPTSGTLPR